MDCDHHLLIDVGASTVLHNNLGDRGPDLGAPNLRYGGVGSLDGRSIDLLVTPTPTRTLTQPEP